MQQQALADRFNHFLNDTRNLITLDTAARETREKALEVEYRLLQQAFSRLGPKQVQAVLAGTTDQAAPALIQHLILGRNQVRRVQRPLVKFIDQDPGRTDWALSEFMTTQAAYRLIQDGRTRAGKSKTAELDERSARLLSGILGAEGVELTAEFAKKVRGELLAATLAYAHSRKCRADMQAWKDDPKLAKRYGKDKLEDYLCDCITRANLPLYYGIRETDGQPAELACVFLEHGNAASETNKAVDGLGSTAIKQQADAFCVNHDEKLFIVGSATTNGNYDAKQMESLVRQVKALEYLAENDPRYKGYTVKPFFFHSGYFCASAEGASGQGKEFVEQLRADGMPQGQIEALARMAFFNLLAERHPHPEAGRIFCLTNPHVAGCGTLPQYEASEIARGLAQGDRRGAVEVMKSLEVAAGAMASDAFTASKGSLRETLVHGLLNAVSNFYTCFPLQAQAKLGEEETRVLGAIGEHLAVVSKKLGESEGYGNAAAQMRRLVRTLQRPDDLEEDIRDSAQSSVNKGRYVWSNEIHASLCKSKGVFDVDIGYIEQHATNFLGELYEGKIPALIAHAIRYCKHKTCPIVLDETADKLLLAAVRSMDEIAETATSWSKRSPCESDGDMGSNESFVESLRIQGRKIQKQGKGEPNVASALFNTLASLFQMNHDELSGKSRSIAFGRHAPPFIKACLESGDAALGLLALESMNGAAHAALPARKHRKI